MENINSMRMSGLNFVFSRFLVSGLTIVSCISLVESSLGLISHGIPCSITTFQHNGSSWVTANMYIASNIAQNLPAIGNSFQIARIDISGDCEMEVYLSSGCPQNEFVGTFRNYGSTPSIVYSAFGLYFAPSCTTCSGSTCPPYSGTSNWHTIDSNHNKSFCSCYDSGSVCGTTGLLDLGFYFRCVRLATLSTAPTFVPTSSPTFLPSFTPSFVPSLEPTLGPTLTPASSPTSSPSSVPFVNPSTMPTAAPSSTPSGVPSSNPSFHPTSIPSFAPTNTPSSHPSVIPSVEPSAGPTSIPTSPPSGSPSSLPSRAPTTIPSASPSSIPSTVPSRSPSVAPSLMPTAHPSLHPSKSPSQVPSNAPSDNPTRVPSSPPTSAPSLSPSLSPSVAPTTSPTHLPTRNPTVSCGLSITVAVVGHKVWDGVYEKRNESSSSPNRPFYVAFNSAKRIVWNDTTSAWNIDVPGVSSLSYQYTPPLSERSFRPPIGDRTTFVDWVVRQTNETVQATLWCGNESTTVPPSIPTPAASAFDSIRNSEPTVAFLLTSLVVAISMIVYGLSRAFMCVRKGGDPMNHNAIVLFGLQVLDVLTDVLFAASIRGARKNPLRLIFFFAFAFVFGPYLVNLVALLKLMNDWKERKSARLNFWLSQHSGILILTWALSGSSAIAVKIASSRLFYLELFCLPLRRDEIEKLSQIRLITNVLLENVPQIALQGFYLATVPGAYTAIPIMSLTMSLLGVVLVVAMELARCQVETSLYNDGVHFLLSVRTDGAKKHHLTSWKKVEAAISKASGIPEQVIEVYDISEPEATYGNGLRICGVVSGKEAALVALESQLIDLNGEHTQYSAALMKELENRLRLSSHIVTLSIDCVERRERRATFDVISLVALSSSRGGSPSPSI